MTELRAGLRVGEFVLEEPLGEGGFAVVWRARHHVIPERRVAAKLLRDPERASMLQDEARCLSRLVHPGVPGLIGLDLDHDPPYLLLELHEGRTLRQLLQAEGRLPPARAYALFAQIVAALAHAHGLGIAHADLKPENVLVDADDQVKLTDFGLGRVVASEASLLLSGSLATTDDASLAGTLPYMAPEQREGQPADPACDVFALGILLHEMLTGRRPQPGDHPSEHLGEPPVWLSVWDRCFTRRDRRFQDAGQVAEYLGVSKRGGGGGRRIELQSLAPPVHASGPWTLDEVERAVARELGVKMADLLAPKEDDQPVLDRLMSWAEDHLLGESRRTSQARRLTWYLAHTYLDAPLRELAERYGTSVSDVQEGIRAVAHGQAGLKAWRGVVERLAPLPKGFLEQARRAELRASGTQSAKAAAAWAGAVVAFVMGMVLLFVNPAMGLALLAASPVLGAAGIVAMGRKVDRTRWLEERLDQLPGRDRREKLTRVAMHSELGTVAHAAKALLAATAPALEARSETAPEAPQRWEPELTPPSELPLAEAPLTGSAEAEVSSEASEASEWEAFKLVRGAEQALEAPRARLRSAETEPTGELEEAVTPAAASAAEGPASAAPDVEVGAAAEHDPAAEEAAASEAELPRAAEGEPRATTEDAPAAEPERARSPEVPASTPAGPDPEPRRPSLEEALAARRASEPDEDEPPLDEAPGRISLDEAIRRRREDVRRREALARNRGESGPDRALEPDG